MFSLSHQPRVAGRNVLINAFSVWLLRYMEHEDFHGAGEAAGVRMKPKNTVVAEWPLRLKLRPHQKGAKEEFEEKLGSSHTGVERYVEWQRSS